jgi:hypothetical protein
VRRGGRSGQGNAAVVSADTQQAHPTPQLQQQQPQAAPVAQASPARSRHGRGSRGGAASHQASNGGVGSGEGSNGQRQSRAPTGQVRLSHLANELSIVDCCALPLASSMLEGTAAHYNQVMPVPAVSAGRHSAC